MLRLLCICTCTALAAALHIHGTYQHGQFFKFLAKYGFQQTVITDSANTQGYIFGNITTEDQSYNNRLTLVVVDSEYLVDYYAMSSKRECPSMFNKIDKIAWGGYCKPDGPEDFLRKVPCAKGAHCIDETDPSNVLPGYQFTYHIEDYVRPRFWYISIVSCDRVFPGCIWSYNASHPNFEVTYDIWLVNGSPDRSHVNPFEHQFSFEMHDVLEIYLTFGLLNAVLLAVQAHALARRRHPLAALLTAVVTLDTAALLSDLVHAVVLAANGVGAPALSIGGRFVGTCAQCLFMLVLLLVAKGWTITFKRLNRKVVLFGVWSLYFLAYVVLFVWNQFVVDIVADVDEWQTWPGYITLAFRLVMMAWFLYELLKSFAAEEQKDKQQFYLRFAAGFLVWFIYLPVVALIGTAVPTLWRFKTLLCLQLGANLLFLIILVHLMWPGNNDNYFSIEAPARRFLSPARRATRSHHDGNSGEIDRETEVLVSDNDESSADELYMRQVAVNVSYAAENGRLVT